MTDQPPYEHRTNVLEALQAREAFEQYMARSSESVFTLRRGGLVSQDDAIQVYQACEEVLTSDQQFETRRDFRQAVKAKLRGEPYGFDPFTILLIAKLILLFIELWMKFSEKARGMREG